MSNKCTSRTFGYNVEFFDCSRGSFANNQTFNGRATFERDKGPYNSSCDVFWVAVEGVRTNIFVHPDGATLTVTCDNPVDPYDCISGRCLAATVYSTPGKFETKSGCEANCFSGSGGTGECIDPAEIVALNQAVAAVQSRLCG